MSDADDVIRRVLDLLETTSAQKRDNVRTILLAQFGSDIIPHCVNKYLELPPAEYRAQLVRFVLQYARVDLRSVEFARRALSDRSGKVRFNSCAVLAWSLRESELEYLRPLLKDADPKTADDARRAIEAIRSQNQNRYYPNHSSWGVMPDNPDYPNREVVQRYLIELAPELVAPLTSIMGDLTQRWRAPTS